ncbi:hypothetical protein Tcan_15636 [Toxocara canis]|uniref:Uncharacterized protein n=2 Tax=Toxocara canis TaxID=6265 RepID=A0A0B2VIZ1_TOXCA|nr:hypothetical protein Tcan_15636 [Toxocara canis]VDM44947.1 unnamed protein product [Toxocara canis]
MLFIGNPRPVDCATECDEDDHKPDASFSERWDITKVVICGVFLYVLTSMFSIILYYPVSLISLIFPAIVLLYTVLALRGDKRQNLWFCVIAGFAGFTLKISAIIIFFMMFPIGQEEPKLRTPSIKKFTSITDLSAADSKTIFFGIVCLMDLFIAIISCCMQWHLIAFNRCAPKQHRMRRVGHPL